MRPTPEMQCNFQIFRNVKGGTFEGDMDGLAARGDSCNRDEF